MDYAGKTVAFPFNAEHPYLVGVVTDELEDGRLAIMLYDPIPVPASRLHRQSHKKMQHIMLMHRGKCTVVPEVRHESSG